MKFSQKKNLTAQQIDHPRKLIAQGNCIDDVAALLNASGATLHRAL